MYEIVKCLTLTMFSIVIKICSQEVSKSSICCHLHFTRCPNYFGIKCCIMCVYVYYNDYPATPLFM